MKFGRREGGLGGDEMERSRRRRRRRRGRKVDSKLTQ